MTARQLTVAHQLPGECAYCDERHAAVVAAVGHELAERIRAWATDPMTDAGAPEYGSVENVLDAADRIDPKEEEE